MESSKFSKLKADVILLSDVAKRLLTFTILRNSTCQKDSFVNYVCSIENSCDAATLKDGPLWPQYIPILTSFRLVYSLHKTSSLLQLRKEIPFELISKKNKIKMQLLKFFLFLLPALSLPVATVKEEGLRRARRDIISRNRMLNRVKLHQASRSRNSQKIGEEDYLQQIKELLNNRSTRSLRGLRIPGIIRLG